MEAARGRRVPGTTDLVTQASLDRARSAVVTVACRESQIARIGYIDQQMTDAERLKEMPPEHRAVLMANLRSLDAEARLG
jgi:hypothetical protein